MARRKVAAASAASDAEVSEVLESVLQASDFIMLDPESIIADDNVREAPTKDRVNQMAESIQAKGQIQPVEVEPMEDGTYRLTVGFRRHAAFRLLNKQGANLMIAATVVPLNGMGEAGRVLRQVAENHDREDFSPIAEAKAIDRLKKLSVDNKTIRAAFSKPTGPNGEMQPASNGHINMVHRFLEFSKDIQKLISSGVLGTKAAYQLYRRPEADRAGIIEGILKTRQAEVDKEAAEEEKLAELLTLMKETAQAAETAAIELEVTKALSDVKIQECADAARDMELIPVTEKETRAKMQEHVKALRADAAALAKKLKTDTTTSERWEAAAESVKTKLETAQAPKAPKPIKAGEIEDAAPLAEKEGGPTPLNLREVREIVKNLSLPGSYPKVQEIGKLFESCFSGEWGSAETAERKLGRSLAVFTGEKGKGK